MTIHEIVNQLFHLSVNSRFNGDTFTRQELEGYIRKAFIPNRIKEPLFMSIRLNDSDSDWLFTVDRFSDSSDGFDYYIPDTREEEKRLYTVKSGG